jgi:hypothetical protein
MASQHPQGTSPIDKKPDPNAPKKKPSPVASKLEEISQTEDDAVFTRQVLSLASEIMGDKS